jgi:hypothetical protein
MLRDSRLQFLILVDRASTMTRCTSRMAELVCEKRMMCEFALATSRNAMSTAICRSLLGSLTRSRRRAAQTTRMFVAFLLTESLPQVE